MAMLCAENFKNPQESAEKIYYTKRDMVEAYVLKKAYVRFDIFSIGKFGCIYNQAGCIFDSCINGRKEIQKRIQPVELKTESSLDVKERTCVLTRLWSNNYYHFWNEIIDKLLIAEELGFSGKYVLFKEPFAEEVLSLIGLSMDRIMWVEACMLGNTYKFDELFEIEGFIGNSLRGISRISNLADKINARFPVEGFSEYPRKVYVKRIGRRKLLNEDSFFEKHNFYIMVPEEHTIMEQIKYFYYADIVICPHGAALSNVCFMRKGSTFIETFSNSLINLTSFRMLRYRKAHYRMVVESNIEALSEGSNNQRDYCVDERLLEYMIEECDKN